MTTLYIDYMYNERQIRLKLTNDRRASTQVNLENDDLLNIFNEVERTLTND